MRIIAKPEVSKLKSTHIKSKIRAPGIILERPKYDPQSERNSAFYCEDFDFLICLFIFDM